MFIILILSSNNNQPNFTTSNQRLELRPCGRVKNPNRRVSAVIRTTTVMSLNVGLNRRVQEGEQGWSSLQDGVEVEGCSRCLV